MLNLTIGALRQAVVENSIARRAEILERKDRHASNPTLRAESDIAVVNLEEVRLMVMIQIAQELNEIKTILAERVARENET